MFTHVPAGLAPGSPLVVVLHGCLQDAESYDRGAGWSTLADREGFALLFAEQGRDNNPNACFNWFRPDDVRRGGGEAASIAEMIGHAVAAFGIDPGRVFLTGLSAGGAMGAAVLAAYPELFAAGAIVAGLPYRAAGDVREALSAMAEGRERTAREWGDLARAATEHRGRWPRLSVWHGEDDTVVNPRNADAVVAQWRDLLGLPAAPSTDHAAGRERRRTWRRDGQALLEAVTVSGMGHGMPIDVASGLGTAGAYFLDVGISSTERIAAFFGLTGVAAERPASEPRRRPPGKGTPRVEPWPTVGGALGRLLKAAGLMR
jgi:poly(hydroxyalkanoate) depolymerase family esterase